MGTTNTNTSSSAGIGEYQLFVDDGVVYKMNTTFGQVQYYCETLRIWRSK